MISQQLFGIRKSPVRRGAEDEVNQATNYGVCVAPATVADGELYWKIVHIQHLSPEENGGKHNVFVDALDEQGQRCQEPALRIGWTWDGRRADENADPKPLDKPLNEPAGNVDLYKGQHLEVWLQGDSCPSDHVQNLHTDHADERTLTGALGNSIGHHSFHLIFQRTRKTADLPTPAGGGTAPSGNNVGKAEPLPLPIGADAATAVLVNTWNRLGDLILAEAAQLGIDPSVATAVLVAAVVGEPLGADGRLNIRFENHIFYQYWGQRNEAQFRQWFTFDPARGWLGQQWRAEANAGWQPCHRDQTGEWQIFEFARQLDEQAALCALSMGALQVMGFNYKMFGYSTVQALFQAFQLDVRNQFRSLFHFIETSGLAEALRNQDFQAFTRVYNGPGQANYYSALIRNYLAIFQGLRPAARALDTTGTPRAPMPPSPLPGKPLAEADPALYGAWRKHMQDGFQNNQTMFQQVLQGFMTPYWTTVWMYRALFGIGIGAFIVAALLGTLGATGRTNTGVAVSATVVFGGLGVAAFLTYFVNRPLQALEENLQFITWLGIIYNTYWTRLAYTSELSTVQQELQLATDDTIAKIKELMDKHTELSGKRPNLPNQP